MRPPRRNIGPATMTAHARIIRSLVVLSALVLSHAASAAPLRISPERLDIHPLAGGQRVVVTLTDDRAERERLQPTFQKLHAPHGAAVCE
jgi:hypothetical protein